MHYLATDDPSKAIVCLQSVLRTDANNLNAWESLADAYFNRGSYTSALKAYDKVLQLHKAWTSLFVDGILIRSKMSQLSPQAQAGLHQERVLSAKQCSHGLSGQVSHPSGPG